MPIFHKLLQGVFEPIVYHFFSLRITHTILIEKV